MSRNSRTFFLNRDTTFQAPSGQSIPYNEVRMPFGTPQAFNNCEICLTKATLYYSWFNVTSIIGNTSFTYSIPISITNSSLRTTYTVTLSDGLYGEEDIEKALHADMKTRGFYFKPVAEGSTLPDIYPIRIQADPVFYRTKITTLPIFPPPDPTGSDITMPDYYWVADKTSTVLYHPQLVIPSSTFGAEAVAGGNSNRNSSISRMLGFAPGSYPLTETISPSQVTLGTFSPVMTLQNLLMFNCNLANEPSMTLYNQCLSQFIPSGSSGVQLEFADPTPTWHQISDGMISYISVFVTDEHNLPYVMNDPIMCVTVQVRERERNRN